MSHWWRQDGESGQNAPAPEKSHCTNEPVRAFVTTECSTLKSDEMSSRDSLHVPVCQCDHEISKPTQERKTLLSCMNVTLKYWESGDVLVQKCKQISHDNDNSARQSGQYWLQVIQTVARFSYICKTMTATMHRHSQTRELIFILMI